MFSLTERDRQAEWMDQPDLDVRLHHDALRGLRRINWLTGIGQRFWRKLKILARKNAARPLRVLDVACGGGDIALRLAMRAHRAGIPMHFTGCDISPTAVRTAQAAAEQAGSQSVDFFQHDVLAQELPAEYDVVMCSLFLHHLSNEDAELVLRRMAAATRVAVLVDDLLRTNVGYWLAWAGARALSRSPVVHLDGPLSVRAAFSLNEARDLAQRAGLQDARFSRHWPQRFSLHWSRP